MKNRLTRACALLCALALLVPMLGTPARAAQDRLFEQTDLIGRGLRVSTEQRKNADGSALRLFTLDYTPGQAVTPLVVYGDKVYGRSDIDFAIQYAQAQGYTTLAAVNADYFSLESGVPTGMLIRDGRLCVSDGAWNAVAFFADGTAMAGTPRLSMSYTRLSNGQATPIYALNKMRTGAGIYLYTEDFWPTTRTTAAGAEVVLDIAPGDCLRLGQPLTATVSAIHRTTPSTPIGPNQMVLSLTEANTAGATFGDLQVGEVIVISASTVDPRWHAAVSCVGGGNMLAQNGVITANATTSKDPRTVLGVRPDGSVSILVCDGRAPGQSDGISLLEAAQRLLALGCVDIVNMDGGGSTTVSYREAGYPEARVQNRPSDGSVRACANYILFVNAGDPGLPASQAVTYPRTARVLTGASLLLEARTVNADFYATGLYTGPMQVLEGAGTIQDGLYIAPQQAGTERVGVADAGLWNLPAAITVTEHPQTMQLVRAGTTAALSSLAVAEGSVTDLDVYLTDGLFPITCQDSQFTFSVTGGVGSIDQNGVLTAGTAPGLSGTVTATWREYSVTLPVTVGRAPEVLDDFEHEPLFVPALAEGSTAGARAESRRAPENARYGLGSLFLAYNTTRADEIISFAAPQPYPLSGGATAVSLMVRGKGDFGLDFITPQGAVRVPFAADESGWQLVAVQVPAGATAVAGFSASGAGSLTGAVYLDQLMAHFGAAAQDQTPPQIAGLAFDPLTGFVTATVTDDYPFPLTAAMLTLTLDGAALPFAFDGETGLLAAQLGPLPEGLHRVGLVVRDHFLNTARQSLSIGQSVPTAYEDMSGHWAEEPVEYLRARGVLADEALFNPQQKVYNEMAATLIARFMGVDVTLYAGHDMPYADADAVSDWAAPYVKAMYYEGIMVGSDNADGLRVFSPQSDTSRAQVMTILARTLARGYAYPAADFDDYADIPLWARDHIDLLAGLGVVNGYAGTREVRPTGTITRAEVASLFFKLY